MNKNRRFKMSMLSGALLVGSGVLDPSISSAADRPDMTTRAQWKAKPAIEERMKPHIPSEIIIHHTSVRQQPKISLERKMRGLQGFSMRPGKVGRRKKAAWGDVPYHFYIGVSGRTAVGRDIAYAGDTNTKYDTQGRIQVVLEGHFDNQKPKPEQLTAMTSLTLWLAEKYKIGADKITGHNDHASTDCPGKNLKKHLPTLREKVSAVK